MTDRTGVIDRPGTKPAGSVLARMLSLLGAFRDGGEDGLTVKSLSVRTGLPMSTTHRLVRQLESEGMLERLESGEYRIGLRLWELGTLAPRAQGMRETALPFLEDLYEVTHQNVQLVVLDGAEIVVLERLRSRDAVRLASRAGVRLPAHATSGGIALLTWGRAVALDAVLAAPRQAHTDRTLVDEKDLRALLATCRRHGYVELDGHLTPGTVSLAAPVLGRDRIAVAAVSVVGSSDHDVRAVLPALLVTARAVSHALSVSASIDNVRHQNRRGWFGSLSIARDVRHASGDVLPR